MESCCRRVLGAMATRASGRDRPCSGQSCSGCINCISSRRVLSVRSCVTVFQPHSPETLALNWFPWDSIKRFAAIRCSVSVSLGEILPRVRFTLNQFVPHFLLLLLRVRQLEDDCQVWRPCCPLHFAKKDFQLLIAPQGPLSRGSCDLLPLGLNTILARQSNKGHIRSESNRRGFGSLVPRYKPKTKSCATDGWKRQ
jgi:hypothetical protein